MDTVAGLHLDLALRDNVFDDHLPVHRLATDGEELAFAGEGVCRAIAVGQAVTDEATADDAGLQVPFLGVVKLVELRESAAQLTSSAAVSTRSRGTSRPASRRSPGWMTRWVTLSVAGSMTTRRTSPHAPSEQLALAPIANWISAAIAACPSGPPGRWHSECNLALCRRPGPVQWLCCRAGTGYYKT
jgi:hypothetical protein